MTAQRFACRKSSQPGLRPPIPFSLSRANKFTVGKQSCTLAFKVSPGWCPPFGPWPPEAEARPKAGAVKYEVFVPDRLSCSMKKNISTPQAPLRSVVRDVLRQFRMASARRPSRAELQVSKRSSIALSHYLKRGQRKASSVPTFRGARRSAAQRPSKIWSLRLLSQTALLL